MEQEDHDHWGYLWSHWFLGSKPGVYREEVQGARLEVRHLEHYHAQLPNFYHRQENKHHLFHPDMLLTMQTAHAVFPNPE